MAKTAKTGRAGEKAGARPVKTRDERDTRTASERRRDDQEESKRRADAAEEGADDGSGEEVDFNQMPLNHQTIVDHRDVGLPPEATPREGKTSPHPPLSPALQGGTPRTRGKIPGFTRMVQATQLGYYNDARRRPGDVFAIRPEFEDADGNTVNDFSSRWMRDAPKGAVERITTPNQAIAGENARTRALRAGSPFPSTPNAITGGPAAGMDQAVEQNPLED